MSSTTSTGRLVAVLVSQGHDAQGALPQRERWSAYLNTPQVSAPPHVCLLPSTKRPQSAATGAGAPHPSNEGHVPGAAVGTRHAPAPLRTTRAPSLPRIAGGIPGSEPSGGLRGRLTAVARLFVMRRGHHLLQRLRAVAALTNLEVGMEVGTARTFPAPVAHLTDGEMRDGASRRRSKLPGLDSNQQPSG